MNTSITRRAVSRIILFVTITCLLLMSFFSYRKIKDLIDFGTSIQRVQEFQNNLERLFSAVKDAESSQRGYFITLDSSFLETYNKSLIDINNFHQELDTMVKFSAIQEKRVDTLTSLINSRLVILNYLLKMEKEILLPQSHDQLNTVMKHGKETMDQIRLVIIRMQIHEDTLLNKDRKEKDRLITLTPLFLLLLSFSAIGLLLISYFAMMNELGKRQQFEKELRTKIEELNRSNIDLEQFAYVASHDLQEPLRKIRSFGDRLVIKHAPNLDDDAKSTITKIQNAAGRMQVLIDDLLSFSRLNNEPGKTQNQDFNILLKEVLADMEVAIRNKNAKVFSGPLPVLNVVPSMIRQLFQNLISNSLKFARPNIQTVISIASTRVKGIEIENLIHGHQNDWYYKIEFSDNGIGFEEKYLDRIFVIFQRLHGKLEYEGTGIGLAVCKKIMLIHQGYITASSSPENGATFMLYFPENA